MKLRIAPWIALVLGCSSSSADSTTSAAASAATPTSADALLQARLQRAVRERSVTAALRGPNGPYTYAQGAEPPAPGIAPAPTMGPATAEGKLPREVIHRIARQNAARFRPCYEKQLQSTPAVEGRVTTTFTITKTGEVSAVKAASDFGDKAFSDCIESGFRGLVFPEPEAGEVKVSYPIVFAPPVTPAKANTPAAPPPPPPEVDPTGPWPIVSIEGTSVKLDGVEVGTTAGIERAKGLERLDSLFVALKTRRAEWREKHPGQAFPGVVGLRVDAGVQSRIVKSIVQTISHAGYPDALVQSVTSPETIVNVGAQADYVPKGLGPFGSALVPSAASVPTGSSGPAPAPTGLFEPAPPTTLEPAPASTEAMFHLALRREEVRITWKNGSLVGAEATVKREGDVSKAVCELWSKHGLHREPNDPRADLLVLHPADEEPYDDVVKIASAVLMCARGDKPAFWLQLALR